jgi:hypothetical protein
MQSQSFVTTLSLIAAANLAMSTASYAAPQNPPSAPVTVVNTAANPVPVSGSITVTGTSNVNVTNASIPVTGSVNASQSGTWNVGITGTPSVSISGPVSVIPAPVAPVQTDIASDCYLVPANQRLVIEFVSAILNAPSDDARFVFLISTSLANHSVGHTVPVQKTTIVNSGGTAQANVYTGALPLRAYADGGTSVCPAFDFIENGPIFEERVVISGYLVPLQ